MQTEEIVKENGVAPPAGEQRTVADLIATIRSAQRWGGNKNPSRFVLHDCVQALTDLARQLQGAHAEIAMLRDIGTRAELRDIGTRAELRDIGTRAEALARCSRDLERIGDPDTAVAVRELATLTAAREPAPESIADQLHAK